MAESHGPAVLTIYVDPNSVTRVRVGRITAHGEEILSPEPEVAAICAHIYQHLARGNSLGGESVTAALESAAALLDTAAQRLAEPVAAMQSMVSALHSMSTRLDNLEQLLRGRVMTVESTQAWIDQQRNKPPVPSRGQ